MVVLPDSSLDYSVCPNDSRALRGEYKMNIYRAAAIILGAASGLGLGLILKIAIREIIDSRSRAVQLPLSIPPATKEEDRRLQPV
jgi:hypothetical protein